MRITVQLVCVCIHVLVPRTDGRLSNDNIHITGPESFITDGSRRLTLTCLATDADQGTGYSWAPAQTNCIDYIQSSGTCTLQPRLDQDGLRIICTAVDSQGSASQDSYTLKLKYPPQKPPFIANSRQSKFLPVGGTVTCTVQGGKPLVTAVHFNCTNQHLTNDVSKPVGTSVSSSVTISTTQTTDDDTTCYCWATWEPEPGLYTLTSQKSFQIAYPPEAPEISGYTPGQILRDGDTLTCTVNGGKPPVSDINFRCTNPDLHGVINTTGSSQLTFNTTPATKDSTICTCSAVWDPDPDLYKLTSNITVSTKLSPSKGGDPFPYWAIIVIVLILTLAAVGIAVARRVLK